MVAYSFQPRFAEPILAGTKDQTIRTVGRRRHAGPGDALQLYTGMRTRHCRLIARAVCAATYTVSLMFHADPRRDQVIIPVTADDLTLDAFARRDGFASWDDLRAFWARHHPRVERFAGVLIRWHPIGEEPHK